MESPIEYIPGFELTKTSGNIIVIPDLEELEKAGTPSKVKGQKKVTNVKSYEFWNNFHLYS